MAYTYWLLRFVPDVLRGERVNVGVIVGQDDGPDWAMRRVESYNRARLLGGPDPRYVEPLLERLEALVGRGDREMFDDLAERPSFPRMETIRQHQGNNLQLSQPRAVTAASAADAADMLFARLVVEPARRDRSGAKSVAVTEMRHAFREVIRPDALRDRVNLRTGQQQSRFDFAVGRDDVVQLTDVWSFNVHRLDQLTQRLQAASYVMGRMRSSGGVVVSKDQKIAVDQDLPLRVLYIEPRSKEQVDVFDQAAEAWRDLGVRSWPVERADELAREAAAFAT